MHIRIFALGLVALGTAGTGCKERAPSPRSGQRGATPDGSAGVNANHNTGSGVSADTGARVMRRPGPTIAKPSPWLKIMAQRYRDRLPDLWQPHPCHPDAEWYSEREHWAELGLASLPEVEAHWETNAGVIRSNGRAVGVDLTGLTEPEALDLVSKQDQPLRWVRWRNAKVLWPAVLRALSQRAVTPRKPIHGSHGTYGTDATGGLFLALPDFEGSPKALAGLSAAGARITGLMLSADRLSAAALRTLATLPNLRSLTVGRAKLQPTAWRELRRFAQLEHLTLESLPVSSAGLDHVAHIPRLRRLVINGDTVDPSSAVVATLNSAAVAKLAAAKGLRELQLSGFTKTGDVSTPISKLRNLRLLTLERDKLGDAALARIATLPRLVALTIAAEDVTDPGLAPLSGRQVLRCLALPRSPITKAGLVHIAALKRLVSLRLGSSVLTSLAPLSGRLPNLEVLHLRSTGIADDALRVLSGFQRLRHVNLMGTNVTDAGLAPLSKLGLLRALHLSNASLSGDGVKHLSGLTQLRVLSLPMETTHFDLAHLTGLTELRQLQLYVPLTAKNAHHLTALHKLQRLHLDKVTPGGLAQVPKLTQLRMLTLPRQVNDGAMRPVGRLKLLRKLDLTKANITDVGLLRLRGLVHLRSLILEQTAVGDRGLVILKGMGQLRRLSLNDTHATGASLRHLAGLKTLRVLDLGHAKLKPADLRHLLNLPVLSKLNLDCTGIGDGGLRVLAKLRAVRSLAAGGNGITDRGLRFCRTLGHLQSLNVMYNYGITDAGLLHLPACKGLRVVHLPCTKVTLRGVQRLHRTRVRAPKGPGCWGGYAQVSSFCESWHKIKHRFRKTPAK